MSNDNILGLPPLNSNFGSRNDPLLPDSNNQLVPKGDIKEINTDSIRRRVIIDAEAGYGEYAIHHVVGMKQKVFVDFYNGVQAISEMNQEAQGKPHQEYCDAMSKRLIQTMARHTLGYLEASAERIAQEVHRPPQLEGEPKGFWGTWFR